MYTLVAEVSSAEDSRVIELTGLDPDGFAQGSAQRITRAQLAQTVGAIEAEAHPRWVWESSAQWYPQLLRHGVSVERCYDLQLSGTILSGSEYAEPTEFLRRQGQLIEPPAPGRSAPDHVPFVASASTALAADTSRNNLEPQVQESLFDPLPQTGALGSEELAAEFRNQLTAVRSSPRASRLNLLLAAESAGSLIAAEMQYRGVPWRTEQHEALLVEALGPRPSPGARPAKMEALAAQLRTELNAPKLNPDSAQDLLRALHRAGIEVKRTRSWELEQINHPAIPVLLQYRKLSRLFSAHGWHWLEHWVHDERFRPEYVVGGVVSGRWASRGGGALQIPKQVRSAVQASAGWKLIVADAAQLEPRVLAALAQDEGLARAAQGQDLYAGIAAQGFGERAQAKLALLGAIYGATSGESGRLMPQLGRRYPRAVGLVEEAARAGERGEIVTTYLGRSSPPPAEAWLAAQRSTTQEEQRRADALARSRGRFTRNFVVQGSAAEWASCWLAQLRRRIRQNPRLQAELVFFLHDEVMVHCPEPMAAETSQLISAAAREAKELIFGQIPVDFPVSLAIVDHYDEAK
ncbi:bifunctional 3'-5' exonuclease/DNA polymerase [Acaricomes phytoseiuli]|uniref:bifunctional 3'-5' exonuclease/DNA polymerase n=1 Tax=Acaricomes phytoseiuli TaxID=291968 RepID=UPI00036B8D07|nr:bifunctional 3'-5' exonuclease/DNA polymerase [Acaricomes phytoseiuli]MCW1249682.1 bifunctional 3'-5' exonuclease/DNA polymerase [Acaricomes phytoseiuli]